MAGGATAGATPWWQTGNGANRSANLSSSAPAGYRYDPVQQQYVRTPSSVGSDAGAAFQGLEAGLGPYADPTTAQEFGGFGGGGGATGSIGGYGSAADSARAQQSGPGPDNGGGGTVSTHTSSGFEDMPDTSVAGNWDANNAANQRSQRAQQSMVATPAAVAPIATPTAAPQLQQVNQQPANAAAFAQAKDSVGLQMRGALTGLAGAMAGRGISGSGLEAAGQLGVVNTGQGQLGDVSRQQAVTNANLSNQNAVTAYQGGIAQRAQDIGVGEANLGAATTGREQNIGIAQGNQNSLNTQRAQDLQMQENALNNATTQRGQNIGQNTSEYEANLGAGTARRGQTIGQQTALGEANIGQQTAERGQNVGYAESQNALRQAAMLARQQRMEQALRGLSY